MTAMSIFYSCLVILSVLGAVIGVEICDASYCNYGGLCIEKGRNRTCECVKNVYNGTYCEEVVDYCFPNPCNGGKCK